MATYYVSTSGNDGSNGGSIGNAWRTVQHAANVAGAGDIVNILAGTYEEQVTFPNSGSPGNPITFQGVRGGGGSWDTIIDGSEDETGGWSAVGDGSYTKSLGYTAQLVTGNGLYIFRMHDGVSAGQVSNIMGFAPNGTNNPNGLGTVQFWDGVEAFCRSVGGVTRVRFRNQENPSSMNVRAAGSGAVFDVNGDAYIVFQDLYIRGGHYAIRLRGGANNITIHENYLIHGSNRIWLENVSDITITDNELTLMHIGVETFKAETGGRGAGDWTSIDLGGPTRVSHRNQYNLNKFEVGNSETDDGGIILIDVSDVFISGNYIHHAGMGIVFYGSVQNTEIENNTIEFHWDNAFYINGQVVNGIWHHNLLYDCDHLMRFQDNGSASTIYIYANKFCQPWYPDEGGGAKHMFWDTFSSGGEDNPNSDIQIYHNSYAGGGFSHDVGWEGGPAIQLTSLVIQNNMCSTTDRSSGPVNWNFFNNYEDDTTWFEDVLPTFILPEGHPALDSAPSLVSSGLPGMTAGYYVDGDPDYGAIQGEGEAADTEDPTVSMTAPANLAVVAGAAVVVSADADDNVGVVGVQFQLDGSNLGTEDTSAPYTILWDTTAVSEGVHTLRAIARDDAGNSATSADITVTVDNPAVPTLTNGHLRIRKRFGRWGRF